MRIFDWLFKKNASPKMNEKVEEVSIEQSKNIESIHKDLNRDKRAIIILEEGQSCDVVIFEGKLEKLNDIEWYDDNGEPGDYLKFLLADECEYESLSRLTQDDFVKLIKNKKNIVDLCGLSNLNNIPNEYIYKLDISSHLGWDDALDILYCLKLFLPNEKFVIYKRWGFDEDEYIDEAYVTSENIKQVTESHTQITPLPNQENFNEEAYYHYGYEIPNTVRIFKYSDFQKILKDHKKGMLKLL